MKISKNNLFVIIIIFTIYIIIGYNVYGSNITSFTQFLVLQFAIIVIAISPVAEAVLRLFYGVRKTMTRQESEYLIPLFENICSSARIENKKLSKNIKLYIDDSLTINAFATGLNTIAVTRGAIDTLSEDELTGILSHEVGHLTHGDTLIFSILTVGNILFLFILLLLKITNLVFKIIIGIISPNDREIGIFFDFLIAIVFNLIMFIINSLLLINQRKNEYQADEFAVKISHGEGLLSALYLLSKTEMKQRVSLLERVKATHPNLINRIAHIESML